MTGSPRAELVLVLVSGPAGVGKSRLAQALAVRTGSAVAHGVALP